MDRILFSDRNLRQHVRPLAVFLFFILFLVNGSLLAGVLVAPTSVVLSETDRTGRLTVQNPSDKPKEVSIHFGFGIPESDSVGNVKITLQDTAAVDNPRSALGWIRAFPRKVVLAPGTSQVIRFIARPPKDLPDGEYWARIIVTSQESQATIPAADQDEKITTKLNMVMRTAIALKYRTGNLIAKLDLGPTTAVDRDSSVEVTIPMTNLGNVSYVGILVCRLLDADRNEVTRREIDLAVYDKLTRRFELPLPDGNHRRPLEVAISIKTEGRTDIPEEELVSGNSFEYTMTVE